MRLPRLRFSVRTTILVVAVSGAVMAIVELKAREKRYVDSRMQLVLEEIAVETARNNSRAAARSRALVEQALADYERAFPTEADRLEALNDDSGRDADEQRLRFRDLLYLIPSRHDSSKSFKMRKLELDLLRAGVRVSGLANIPRQDAVQILKGEVRKAKDAESANEKSFDQALLKLAWLRIEVGTPQENRIERSKKPTRHSFRGAQR
jgi:hypothetical protein